jgi:aspartyl-tRNA(Asn)/glutamyl-tRNA(Gln) amidotransferase subunit A
MDAAELCYLPAVELRDKYRSREISPVEVTMAVLERIERLNPALNAYVTLTPEMALEQAREAERMYREDDDPPLLAGVPLSIKDNVAVKGVRTTHGSLLHEHDVPDANPVFVERLLVAGGVLLGKTNLPESGWKGETTNRLFGSTHNPWQLGMTAGGSSGGAGAAVAAGLGQFGQGGDGAGSIRIPASFCGIYGIKPSFARVPSPAGTPLTHMSHPGPMTRTVRDAALMLDVMAGPSPIDRYSLERHASFLSELEGNVRGLRLAWSPNLGYAEVDPEIAEITKRAALRFTELGCEVEEVNPPMADPWPIAEVFFSLSYTLSAEELRERRELIDPGRLPMQEKILSWSAVDVVNAMAARETYWQQMREFMAGYHLLLTPAMPITAFPAGQHAPTEINGKAMDWLGWTGFAYPFNLTGQPAASIPCGFASNGLPVGLQIVGRWRDDAAVLKASAAFESLQPWAQARPLLDYPRAASSPLVDNPIP